MSALRAIIEAEIAANGPMRLSRYMTLCLSHPAHGYYMRQHPFGAAGDFITAPEVSQMFGELIGLWLAHMWQQAGAPAPFTLLELGPGRGTLMADILRAARLVPGFDAAARLHLLESSPRLRAQQRSALPGARHIAGLEALPDAPVFAVANEFFDALPIRQFIRNDFGWQERLVGPGLRWHLGETRPAPGLDAAFGPLETGRIVEVNAPAQAIAADLGAHIRRHGGAALIIDYGSFDGVGDTFQAVRAHKKVDVFAHPGEADLTAHLRFGDLVPKGLAHGFTTQGAFLRALGIEARAAALGDGSALHRLTDASQMGSLFKVLALVPPGGTDIAGFG